jgi:hypothetical protein
MKVMHVGQEVRATHGLTSSHPSGWIVSRGTHGVVTKVVDSEPLLYTAEFRVFDGAAKVVTVKGISSRDIMPLVPSQRVPDSPFSMVS